MGYCPSCGAATNPGASFCHACGATLPQHGTAPPAAAAPTPAPAYAPPPAQRVRPVGVSIIGFVTIAFAAFTIVAGLFVMMFMGALGAFVGSFGFGGSGAVGSFLGALGLLAAMFVFAFAALGILVGVGVLRGSGWAWIAMIVLMGLYAMGGLFELASRDFGGIITIGISALIIWYFFQPDVKAWFGRA